jgi:uncharacterized membrane protein
MTPRTRCLLQAVMYEGFALALVVPFLAVALDRSSLQVLPLAIAMSVTAVSWNYVFNLLFERWESGRAVRGRSLLRRLAHGAGFQGGLVLMLVPMMAWWLDVSLFDAFFADLGVLLFFFVYTIAFTWLFDRVFGLPESAAPRRRD